ncbi:hypothetical protein F4818DRAFT_418500 [Hypoxylon cercidicola]|nr:hypothetical protein F4818DRAFT_418500 [Hypoxylon cercidicola]
MSSIGPQLPPHLSKRKRTPEDESAESPAAKLRATDRAPVNQDEINIDSDDEYDYGQTAPPPKAAGPIGPTMPPSNAEEVQLDDSDSDDIGPTAPPPPPSTRPSIGPSLPPSNNDEITLEDDDSDSDVGPAPPSGPKPAAPAKRVHGPAPPPAPLSERPTTAAAADSDSDSDSDYGPALPTSTSHLARQMQAQAAQAEAAAAAAAAGPKRDDWMLAPPPSAAYKAPDPTKIKSRRFNSGPRTNTSSDGGGGELSSIWTETPEQKRKRLEDAVLGREATPQQHTKSGSANTSKSAARGGERALSKEDIEQQERIRRFTEATRGKSLYEEHRQSRQGRELAAEEEEDDPSRRAFDKEKDMKLGGRIGTAQRRELLNRAADFGGRFAKGKYL